MDGVLVFILKEKGTMANGSIVKSMDLVKTNGQLVIITKELGIRIGAQDMEPTLGGVIILSIQETG